MEKKQSLLNTAMTYGTILGVISILLTLILYIVGYMPINFKRMIVMFIISLGLSIGFVVTGTKSYRDKVLGGSITYWQAFSAGLFIVVFSSVLLSFYNLIFNLFIDPGYMDKVMEAQRNWMFDFLTNMGSPDDKIEEAMSKYEEQKANFTPLKAFFQGIYISVIFGAILSFITSLFIKKNQNPVA